MSIFSDALIEKARHVAAQYVAQQFTLATAESCTGGLLSALFTELPGSSKFFTHGFVTYANAAKIQLLNVPETLLAQHGAVSQPVARAMAEGAMHAANSSCAVAITGIAGPDGGTVQKPVGTLHIAVAVRGGATTHKAYHFTGDRSQIRLSAVDAALGMLKI